MIKQTTKDRLKELGIDPEALETAIKADTEVDVTLPDGSLFTDTQLADRDKVKVGEGEKSGEKKATEIAKKELAKQGLDLKGERWGDIATEIKGAINSTGDDKLKALQEQNSLLLKDKETLTTELTTNKSKYEQSMFDVEVMSKLPAIPSGFTSLKEAFEVMKMRGYSVEQADGVTVVKKGGEVLRDKTTQAPLALDAGIKAIYAEQKWTPEPQQGGRGASQQPLGGGGVFKKTSELAAHLSEQGENIMSEKGQAMLAKAMADKDFDVNG